jgi:hypothetical protein
VSLRVDDAQPRVTAADASWQRAALPQGSPGARSAGRTAQQSTRPAGRMACPAASRPRAPAVGH